ncbi:type II toxin-antitoxin system VapB family antitoxin [Streptomyces sp. NPDC096153]|uniref:type II toxin-antitoxin system VapB family antitoxin n=1 Tax=Streptomyces sp. NPDC096153 TaxID=3155548 RepID=UPI00332A74FF
MSVTQIDLDDDALTAVMRASGARSKKEAVNLALREYAQRKTRAAAFTRFYEDAEGWADDMVADAGRAHRVEKAGRGV